VDDAPTSSRFVYLESSTKGHSSQTPYPIALGTPPMSRAKVLAFPPLELAQVPLTLKPPLMPPFHTLEGHRESLSAHRQQGPPRETLLSYALGLALRMKLPLHPYERGNLL
jgi:hypothetical protein